MARAATLPFDLPATKTLVGDCRHLLPTLATESIQCCVTSPPYWGLRDYDHPDQIGAETSPDLYVADLVSIFREVRRVLRQDGTLWLNVGDGYARNGGTGNCGPNAVVGNTRKLIQKRNCKVPEVWGLKDRDLMGLPWRVAFALQADGWILRSKITWIKKTAMPESVKNRPTSATEEVFLFSKSPSYSSTIRTGCEKKRERTCGTIGFWGRTPAPMDILRRFRGSSHAGASCWVRARATVCWTHSVVAERRVSPQKN